jgi:hypothetical protein
VHLLDSNHVQRQTLIKRQHGINNHGRKEFLLVRDKFGVHGSGSTLDKHLSALDRVLLLADVDCPRVQKIDGELACGAKGLDNEVRMYAIFDKSFHLLKELCRENDNTRGAVANLRILGKRNVDESFGGWVGNLQTLHQSGSIVGDGDLATIVNELVHAAGTKSGADDIGDGSARIDVGHKLGLPLRGVCAFTQQNDSRLHSELSHFCRSSAIRLQGAMRLRNGQFFQAASTACPPLASG